MGTTIVTEPDEVFRTCESARRSGRRVAVVPTMGALHDGHLSLVRLAAESSNFQVVTIFVNPTQFGEGEDLEKYPRVLDDDRRKLAPFDVDLIFAPSPEAMYPDGFGTIVSVSGVTEGLCGNHRPNHFDGVATVVTKLLNIVGPCRAVFGRKDYQQLQVIKKLIRDLNLPVETLEAPIVREPDGLAMSSRNAYLSPEERARALSLSKGLKGAWDRFDRGERNVGTLLTAVEEPVRKGMDEVDYVTAAHPVTLRPIGAMETCEAPMLLAVAARIGETRLIDNVVLGEDPSPIP